MLGRQLVALIIYVSFLSSMIERKRMGAAETGKKFIFIIATVVHIHGLNYIQLHI